MANRQESSLLRRVVAVARDLFQAHDLKSVVEMVGTGAADLLGADEVLLVAKLFGQDYVTEFDRDGRPTPARPSKPLYRKSIEALDSGTPLIGDAQDECLLGFAFPAGQPVGILSALWHSKDRLACVTTQAVVLRYLGELAGAALGNVTYRQALEEQQSSQTEELKAATVERAREADRRDEIDREKDRLAVTDVLTGMLNRRGFFLQAEQGFKTARRQGIASTVIFVDIDGLKLVNDTLGHDVGDRLIEASARILRQSFRDSDVVGRLGGDEFAAYTLDSDQPETILSRISTNVERFHRASSVPYRISFSTGIVRCDPHSDKCLNDYLCLADRRMYEQKRERKPRHH